MEELLLTALQSQLQAYLNCLELCRVLRKQTDEPDVKDALDLVIDDLQDSVASVAGYLRRGGVAPGAYELDGQGRARVRDVLNVGSLTEQLNAVRESLAELVAWYVEHPPADQPDPATRDWLVSLSGQTRRTLECWDQQMREIKAAPF